MLEDVARVCNRFPLIEINVHECKIVKFEKLHLLNLFTEMDIARNPGGF